MRAISVRVAGMARLCLLIRVLWKMRAECGRPYARSAHSTSRSLDRRTPCSRR